MRMVFQVIHDFSNREAVHPLVKVVHPWVKAAHPLVAGENRERMVNTVHPLVAGENTKRTMFCHKRE